VKGLEAGHTEIHPVRFSDHHAIRARVRLAQVEQASSLPRASARRASVLDHTSGRLPYPNHRRRQFPPIRDEQPVANP
jgi:hypothetical protein